MKNVDITEKTHDRIVATFKWIAFKNQQYRDKIAYVFDDSGCLSNVITVTYRSTLEDAIAMRNEMKAMLIRNAGHRGEDADDLYGFSILYDRALHVVSIAQMADGNYAITLQEVPRATESEVTNSPLDLRDCVRAWNDALGSFDLEGHIDWYGQKVNFFGKMLTHDQIRSRRKSFFDGSWTTHLNVVKDIVVEERSADEYVTTFNYQCDVEKNTGKRFKVNVDKILTWRRQGDNWRIVLEKDLRVHSR